MSWGSFDPFHGSRGKPGPFFDFGVPIAANETETRLRSMTLVTEQTSFADGIDIFLNLIAEVGVTVATMREEGQFLGANTAPVFLLGNTKWKMAIR